MCIFPAADESSALENITNHKAGNSGEGFRKHMKIGNFEKLGTSKNNPSRGTFLKSFVDAVGDIQ
jgi:hypothetical protein